MSHQRSKGLGGIFIASRGLYIGLSILVAIVWLSSLSTRPLFNPDEGRYAEIPREMLTSGDWVIPHLNGLAYIEKPPLQFWVTALSFAALGQSEFAARLYVGVAALATIALIWVAARALWGEPAAWRAAAVLASMALFLVLGQLLTLDMSLTFYLTVCLVGFLLAQTRSVPSTAAPSTATRSSTSRVWMLIAWAAAALGVLTKGVVAAAIPAAVLVIYSLLARDLSPWKRLQWRFGLPLFLFLAVPWHWLAAARLDDFLTFFFVHEHLARYLTTEAQRVEPWWYFGAVFLAGSLPWTLFAVRVLPGSSAMAKPAMLNPPSHGVAEFVQRAFSQPFRPELFLRIWVLFVAVFFSLSGSKLIPYILPLFPALALLIGSLPAAILKRDLQVTAAVSIFAGFGLAYASWHLPELLRHSPRAAEFSGLARPLLETAALLVVSGAFVLVQGAADVTRAAVFLGVGWCLGLLLLVRGAAAAAPIYSGLALAQAFPPDAGDAPLYSIAMYDQSLTFYLRRPVTLVQYRGELDYGLRQAPGAPALDLAQFLPEWSRAPRAFAVMEKNMLEPLRERGAPLRVIGEDRDHVLVSRR